MAKTKLYQIKVKLSTAGYKNTFITGLADGKTPKEAQNKTIQFLEEFKTKEGGLFSKANLQITKCTLIKQDFTAIGNK